MESKVKSIRPFIGAKNYQISRNFYRDIGFQEVVLSADLSYFDREGLGFYLQNAYVKDWVNNSMVFMEVFDLEDFWTHLVDLNLKAKYENVKLVPIRKLDWGKECFMYDPSGVLWHFGTFNT
jgi:hypothetical protein